MPSHVLYVDDSGTKEYASSPKDYSTSGNSRYFVFGGVLISTHAAGQLTAKLRNLKDVHFGDEVVEIKSNWLRIPKERSRRYLAPYSVTEGELANFVDECYEAILETDLQLIASVVDKVQVQQQYQQAWYAPAIAYECLVQRVVREITTQNSVAVIVDDMTGKTPKGNPYKVNLGKHHSQLRKSGSSLYKPLSCAPLCADIKFVNSAHSQLLQVADLVAYNVYRQFVQHGEEWESREHQHLPTYKWFARLGRKFRQGPGGRIQGYGVVKFPLIQRVEWALR